MTRNQQISLITMLFVLFVGLTVAAIASMGERPFTSPSEEFKESEEASNRVLSLYENVDTSVPSCYVNHSGMTYQVPCNSQAVVDAKSEYDRRVDEQINDLGQVNQQQ